MNAMRLIIGFLPVVILGPSASGDAPLVDCTGYACGGGGPTAYAYPVDAASYPIMEFRVGTNDLDAARYTGVLTPPGWQFAVEAVPAAHDHAVHTPHGEVSPGPCWCLTAGSVHWWTDDPALAVESFTFGYDQPWSAEDLGWVLTTRREGPPPQYYTFYESWDNPVGWGAGPLHGPSAPIEYCWSSEDCAAEQYCFFEECAAETGVCLPRPEGCPDVWEPVCGCDGITYGNACEAAMVGMSVDHAGACQGELCWENVDCGEPGYCFVEQCAQETGVCLLRPEACPEYVDPVCGCDGVTYDNDCFAAEAGASIAYHAPCLMGDFDLDGDTDLSDFGFLAYCMQGPESGIPLPCAVADLDYDIDVDLADFQVFQNAFGSAVPARIGGYSSSGCLDGTRHYPCGDDVVEFTVAGGTLHVWHGNATYNCCADEIVITLIVEGTVLHLSEEEILTNACFCVCCYEVEATVVDLPPGQYTVEFCWYDFETGGEACFVEEVVIP